MENLLIQSFLNVDDVLDEPFSVDEIEAAVSRLKKGKSGSVDNLLPEHLIYGGPALILWLKQIFNAFIHLEHIPCSFLTGKLTPIYKGKGKDPLKCNSYRGITMMSVIMKAFEYAVLERILPTLKNAGHPLRNQTAYQKSISCRDAIFSTQEIILHTLHEGGHPILSLYDLEKAYDSIEHPILLKCLSEAGLNGKSWRVIKACYDNIQVVVSSNSRYSTPVPFLRGIQQGSVLSPTFFLVVMDKMLQKLEDENAGISICNLFLGGASHADDIRAISTSKKVSENQCKIISNAASLNGLSLNAKKTEVVAFSLHSATNHEVMHNLNVPILTSAKCLGYKWCRSLSPKLAIEENIVKARKQFFALGSSGCFLGSCNPLTAKSIFETCALPTLLYGAENWLLDQPCILKLEKFQAEIGRRILHLSKYHSRLSVLLALRWPSMRARILNIKLSYFHRLLTSDNDSLGTRTFNTLASIDVYKLGLTQQCLFLDSEVGSGTVAELLSNPDSATFHLKQAKANIIKLDWKTSVEMAAARSSMSAIIDTN